MPVIALFLMIIPVIVFWEWVSENVAVLGTVATALAFFATAWAANEARSSAKAAYKAVELTRYSLYETKKSAFKQWFSLLLEKHDEMLKLINSHVSSSKSLQSMLNKNGSVKKLYKLIMRDELLTAYVRHIYLMLNYIDKEFYGSADDVENRALYVGQFSNFINQDVKLIIAVSGLNVTNVKHIDSGKLRFLLLKYYFFKNDLFFADVIYNSECIEIFINKELYESYTNPSMQYINEMLTGTDASQVGFSKSEYATHYDLMLAIFYTYETQAMNTTHYYFEEFESRIRKSISLYFEKVPEKIETFMHKCDSLKNKGFYYDNGSNKIRNLTSEIEIIKSVKVLIRYARKKGKSIFNVTGYIILNSQNGQVLGSEYAQFIKDYADACNLVQFKSKPDKDILIDLLVRKVNEGITKMRTELDALSAFSQS